MLLLLSVRQRIGETNPDSPLDICLTRFCRPLARKNTKELFRTIGRLKIRKGNRRRSIAQIDRANDEWDQRDCECFERTFEVNEVWDDAGALRPFASDLCCFGGSMLGGYRLPYLNL